MNYDNGELNILYSQIIDMLYDYGFSEELYLISKQTDSVHVEFDDKGAVTYFQTQSEKEYPLMLYVEYIKKGKRHVAKVSYW